MYFFAEIIFLSIKNSKGYWLILSFPPYSLLQSLRRIFEVGIIFLMNKFIKTQTGILT